MTKVLVTGAAGHLGAALVDLILERTDWEVNTIGRWGKWPSTGLDRMDHMDRLRVSRWVHDLRAPVPEAFARAADGTDFIFHTAAEVHSIRSLTDPGTFVEGNVLGTFHMLELARKIKPRAFVYVSTAEVYGPSEVAFMPELTLIPHKEADALNPQTPYAASKAAAEALVNSYYRSFQVPTIIARTMNIFGERQAADKFVPKILRKLVDNEVAEIHTSETKADVRQWIHTRNFADALLCLADRGMHGNIYNVAGYSFSNLELAKIISTFAKLPLSYKTKDTSSSPAHSIAYAIEDKKIRALGWGEPRSFSQSLFDTVKWTLEHPEWL